MARLKRTERLTVTRAFFFRFQDSFSSFRVVGSSVAHKIISHNSTKSSPRVVVLTHIPCFGKGNEKFGDLPKQFHFFLCRAAMPVTPPPQWWPPPSPSAAAAQSSASPDENLPVRYDPCALSPRRYRAFATRAIAKGDTVVTEHALAAIILKSQYHNQKGCAFCLAALPSSSSSYVMCAECSNVYYCSTKCREQHAGTHTLTCAESTDSSDPTRAFHDASASHDPIALAAECLAAALANSGGGGQQASQLSNLQPWQPWPDVSAQRANTKKRRRRAAERLWDALEESYASLRFALNYAKNVPLAALPEDARTFACAVLACEANAIPVLSRATSSASASANDTTVAKAKAMGIPDSARRARALVALAERKNNDDRTIGTCCVEAMAVFPTIGRASHSCVPNVQLEAHAGAAPGQSPYAALVALRDIVEGEELTLNYSTIAGSDAESRQADVRSRFFRCANDDGGGDMNHPMWTCTCARCAFDAFGVEAEAAVDIHFALALQEEARYADSEAVLDAWLAVHRGSSKPRDTLIAEHALGVCKLLQGLWDDAHSTWRDASKRYPDHVNPNIDKQLRKDVAFSYWLQSGDSSEQLPYRRVPVPIQPGSLAPPDVFCTIRPALTSEECTRIIDLAEARAAQGNGWTTARHYSVPTTDLPLDSIPEALSIFNAAMKRSINAMLLEQFPQLVNGRTRVAVHDAFVVRYDEHRNALPEHTDESEVSLTIALNDAAEGGGTYFPSTASTVPFDGTVVRPDVGHVVSFAGGTTRHAGEPVSRGVRYIIAAFLYFSKNLV